MCVHYMVDVEMQIIKEVLSKDLALIQHCVSHLTEQSLLADLFCGCLLPSYGQAQIVLETHHQY